jgi:two-component system NarL family response regulator
LEFNKKDGGTEKNVKDNREPDTYEKLTDRQVEILRIIASGKTYKKAGELLGLSERTIKYHMGRIVDILHLENRSQVIAYAAESGLVEPIKTNLP